LLSGTSIDLRRPEKFLNVRQTQEASNMTEAFKSSERIDCRSSRTQRSLISGSRYRQ
jgi:hypothetical protein